MEALLSHPSIASSHFKMTAKLHGKTPIEVAASKGNVGCLKLLLAK